MDATIRMMNRAGLTDDHLALANSLLREIFPDGTQPRLAFVSGSLAAGLGHALSDIDVYVLPPEGVELRFFSYDSPLGMVHINPISESKAHTLVDMCTEFRVTPQNREQIEVSDAILRDTVRFAIGIILHTEFSVPDERVRRDVMRRVILCRNAHDMASYAEDCLGSIQSGDLLTALCASEMSCRLAAEALLAAVDDLYLGPKFLYRRLQRNAMTAALLGELLAELTAVDHRAPPAEITAHVERRLRSAAGWVTMASLYAWEHPWSDETAELFRFADRGDRDGFVRSPWFVPVRYGKSWALTGPDLGLKVNEAVVTVWLACEGTGAAGVEAELAKAYPDRPPITSDALVKGLSKLESVSAIQQR